MTKKGLGINYVDDVQVITAAVSSRVHSPPHPRSLCSTPLFPLSYTPLNSSSVVFSEP